MEGRLEDYREMSRINTEIICRQQEDIKHLEETVEQLRSYIEKTWKQIGYFEGPPIPECLTNVEQYNAEGRPQKSHLWGKPIVKKRKRE